MGSGEEWANDAPDRGGWCSLSLAGIVSSCLLVLYGITVVLRDLVAVAF